MTRAMTAFFAVLVMVASALGVRALLADPEHVRPDHAAPPVAEATAPLPLAAVGGDSETAAIAPLIGWIEENTRVALEGMEAALPRGGSGVATARPASGECGTDWDCFRECTIDHESRSSGIYTAVSPDGVYRGAFQFLGSTWRSVAVNAGFAEWADTPTDQVPPEVQDAVARFLWEHSGNRPWGGRC